MGHMAYGSVLVEHQFFGGWWNTSITKGDGWVTIGKVSQLNIFFFLE